MVLSVVLTGFGKLPTPSKDFAALVRENVRLPRILPRRPRILQRRPLPRVVSWFHGAAPWLQAFIHDITRLRNHAAASTRLRLGLDALAMLLGRRRDVLGVRSEIISG